MAIGGPARGYRQPLDTPLGRRGAAFNGDCAPCQLAIMAGLSLEREQLLSWYAYRSRLGLLARDVAKHSSPPPLPYTRELALEILLSRGVSIAPTRWSGGQAWVQLSMEL